MGNQVGIEILGVGGDLVADPVGQIDRLGLVLQLDFGNDETLAKAARVFEAFA